MLLDLSLSVFLFTATIYVSALTARTIYDLYQSRFWNQHALTSTLTSTAMQPVGAGVSTLGDNYAVYTDELRERAHLKVEPDTSAPVNTSVPGSAATIPLFLEDWINKESEPWAREDLRELAHSVYRECGNWAITKDVLAGMRPADGPSPEGLQRAADQAWSDSVTPQPDSFTPPVDVPKRDLPIETL